MVKTTKECFIDKAGEDSFLIKKNSKKTLIVVAGLEYVDDTTRIEEYNITTFGSNLTLLDYICKIKEDNIPITSPIDYSYNTLAKKHLITTCEQTPCCVHLNGDENLFQILDFINANSGDYFIFWKGDNETKLQSALIETGIN